MFYVASVTFKDWSEEHFLLNSKHFLVAKIEAFRMSKFLNVRRVILHPIEAQDEIELWYRLGERFDNMTPPPRHKTSYELGKKIKLIKQRKRS